MDPAYNIRELSHQEGYYALVRWHISDIVDLAAERGIQMSDEQAEAWLQRNESRLQDRLVEEGWQIIEVMLLDSDDNGASFGAADGSGGGDD